MLVCLFGLRARRLQRQEGYHNGEHIYDISKIPSTLFSNRSPSISNRPSGRYGMSTKLHIKYEQPSLSGTTTSSLAVVE